MGKRNNSRAKGSINEDYISSAPFPALRHVRSYPDSRHAAECRDVPRAAVSNRSKQRSSR
jgi:hypothetical protein